MPSTGENPVRRAAGRWFRRSPDLTYLRISGKPIGPVARLCGVASGLITSRLDGVAIDSREWTADEAVTRLFAAHYRGLVRLAVLLLHDRAVAEEIVQDAYVALHTNWRRLRESDRALGYLRTTVVNRSRSALRRRTVAYRHAAAEPPPSIAPSAESVALDLIEHREMIDTLRRLPARQREALVL